MRAYGRRGLFDLAADHGTWLALLVLVTVSTMLAPTFLTPANLLNILRQASVVGITAVGVTFVMLTRGVDLSVGAVISLTAVLAASIMRGQDANIPFALVAVLLVGATVGFVNGLMVARRNVPSFILTLGVATALGGLTQLFTGGTAAGVVAPAFRGVLNARYGAIPMLVILLGVAFALGLLMQRYTKFGRRLYLVGANPAAAVLAGVPVERTLLVAYVASGLAAAIGGLALLARSGVSSNFAGQGFEFDVLAAVVLGGTTFEGGRGGLAGSLAGVLILVTASNLVNILGLPFNAQLVLKGGIIIGAAALYAASRRKEG